MKKARVLIVDDAKYIHDMISDMLNIDRYEIVGNATDGTQAVALYEELHPDLVIMDLVMENMDGLAATREIIKIDPDAIILVITASTHSKSINEVIDAGAKQHLWKPFMITNLVETVEKLLIQRPVVA
jgi:two-component system chemotaxis response regulator CheY